MQPARLNGLKMVNASIASSQGMVVEGQAWVFGGTLCGCDRFTPAHRSSDPPTFLVLQGMLFGSPDLTFFRDTFGDAYPLARNIENMFEKGWPISIDKLTLQIMGTLHVSVPTIILNNTASLVIDVTGKLAIGAPVSIVNDEKHQTHVSLYNYGVIEHSCTSNYLKLVGNFHQSQEGYMALNLPSTDRWLEDLPLGIWQFEGNSNVTGLFNISFANDIDPATGKNPNPVSIGDAWPIATFTPTEDGGDGTSSFFNVETVHPPGVQLTTSNTDGILSGSVRSDTLSVQIVNIDCGSLQTYANHSYATCWNCLNARSGCSFCNGLCTEDDVASGLPFGSCQQDNCCDSECSDRGDCFEEPLKDEGDGAFTCECDWFFDGDSCSIVSTSGTLVLTCGVSLTLLFIISMAYYQFHNRRKREVVENALEEIRYGLLADGDRKDEKSERNKDSQVTDGYVKSLQQQVRRRGLGARKARRERREERMRSLVPSVLTSRPSTQLALLSRRSCS